MKNNTDGATVVEGTFKANKRRSLRANTRKLRCSLFFYTNQ